MTANASTAVVSAEERKRLRWIVFSVAFAVFMVRLDGYIVVISLPTLARYFQVGTSEVSWVILSYLLVMTGSTLIFGKLIDRVGLKKIFIWGYGFFTLGSLLCGLAPTIYLLDAARCLQGVGGAMMITSGMASIPHYLPENIVGWAFGICSLANSLGIMVGAPLGGLITGFLSWHWIFLINVPVGILAIVIVKRNLPADQNRSPLVERLPFDVSGSILSFVGLTALVFTLSRGDDEGWKSGIILTAFAVAGASLLAFYLRERTVRDPILNLSLFRNRDFSFAILTTLVALMLLSGGNFLIPFYLELIKGLGPEHVGAVVMIYSVVYMPIGPFAGRLSDRINPRRLCTIAMFLAFISCLVIAMTLPLPGLFPAVLYLVLLAVSYALFFPANNHLVMSLAPEGSQGTASAIYTNTMNVGMVLGVCLFEGAFSQTLPASLSTMTLTPEVIRTSLTSVTGAFQFAFIVGAFFSLLAFFLSILSGRHASTARGNQ
ncbi:MAG: DHA2 family efflux MFS transporter permease subunit [Syntrophales bacterium]|nr:DHA2 family efflux MFS transporter permease subunit [Syntrophales bacterium]